MTGDCKGACLNWVPKREKCTIGLLREGCTTRILDSLAYSLACSSALPPPNNFGKNPYPIIDKIFHDTGHGYCDDISKWQPMNTQDDQHRDNLWRQ